MRTWALMRQLNSHIPLPWMYADDFNEVLFNHEKKGATNADAETNRVFIMLCQTMVCLMPVFLGINTHGQMEEREM